MLLAAGAFLIASQGTFLQTRKYQDEFYVLNLKDLL